MKNIPWIFLLSLIMIFAGCKKEKLLTPTPTQEVTFDHNLEVTINNSVQFTDSVSVLHYAHQIDLFPEMGAHDFFIRIADTVKSGTTYPLNVPGGNISIYYEFQSGGESEFFDPKPGSYIKIISNDEETKEIKATFSYIGQSLDQNMVALNNGKLKFNY